MEAEIEEIIKICLQNEREINLNKKLENIFKYKLKLKAINNPAIACENNLLQSLKISHKKGINFQENELLLNICAKNGNLDCMKFLHKIGYLFKKFYCFFSDKKYLNKIVTLWNEKTTYFAAKNNHLDCLKYLHENGCPWDQDSFKISFKKGSLDCLKYLNENGCPKFSEFYRVSLEKHPVECIKYLHTNGCPSTRISAKNGYLNSLKYFHEKGCELNEVVAEYAAENDHLDCLMYLNKNGCPINRYSTYLAAKKGKLNCLKYLHENGFYRSWDTYSTAELIETNNLNCLKYLYENGALIWDEKSTKNSAINGNLECLKYLHENGCPWKKELIITKDLDCLKYLHENGCPWKKELIITKDLDCLKYLHENGCPWNEKTTRFSARYGKLDCLKYLHENGCPWNEKATKNSARYGKLDCLKYLHENGCLWNEKATYYASMNGHLNCLKYLHENGCLWNEKATYYASMNGHLNCLKYLHENGCLWNEKATYYASMNGHLNCLKYLHENGCPWNEKSTIISATNNHLECLTYLLENGCPWSYLATYYAAENENLNCLSYLQNFHYYPILFIEIFVLLPAILATLMRYFTGQSKALDTGAVNFSLTIIGLTLSNFFSNIYISLNYLLAYHFSYLIVTFSEKSSNLRKKMYLFSIFFVCLTFSTISFIVSLNCLQKNSNWDFYWNYVNYEKFTFCSISIISQIYFYFRYVSRIVFEESNQTNHCKEIIKTNIILNFFTLSMYLWYILTDLNNDSHWTSILDYPILGLGLHTFISSIVWVFRLCTLSEKIEKEDNIQDLMKKKEKLFFYQLFKGISYFFCEESESSKKTISLMKMRINKNEKISFNSLKFKAKIKEFSFNELVLIRKNSGIFFKESLKAWRNLIAKDYEVDFGGNSGQTIIKTWDNQLIVKKCTDKEKSNLEKSIMKIFAQYHLEEELSLIVPIYGLISIQFRSPYVTEAKHFLVLKCIDCCENERVLIKFDLKYSEKNRIALNNEEKMVFEEILRNYQTNNILDLKHLKKKVMKDAEFKLFCEKTGFDLAEFCTRNNLEEIIKKDLYFLSKNNLMDYSLFIGFVNLDNLEYKKKCLKWNNFGVVIGIIDFLQKYNIAKKTENAYKKLTGEKNFSCIPPHLYQKRIYEGIFVKY